MTFRPQFEGAALVQLNGLPKEGFEALLERVLALVEAPWDAQILPPGDDPAYRETVFGEGRGLMSFHVDDDTEEIRIFNIVWIG